MNSRLNQLRPSALSRSSCTFRSQHGDEPIEMFETCFRRDASIAPRNFVLSSKQFTREKLCAVSSRSQFPQTQFRAKFQLHFQQFLFGSVSSRVYFVPFHVGTEN